MMNSEEERSLNCNYLVNATGPWAAKVALMAGVGEKTHTDPVLRVALPITPRKRCVFVFKCPTGPVHDCPMIVDHTGPYVRREGTGSTYIAGVSPEEVSIVSM
jgi:FAD-dependent oxidoreductase domain-containing protein 1